MDGFDNRKHYSVKGDVECLRNDNKIVLATTETQKGWAILWYDKKGYTTTYTERLGRGVGGARSFQDGMDEYLDIVRRLV